MRRYFVRCYRYHALPEHRSAKHQVAVSPVEDFYRLGNEANGRGDFAVAAEHYRQALAVRPDWREAQHNLASVLYQLGQIDEALNLFRKAATGPDALFSVGMQAVIVPGSPSANNQTILETRWAWDRLITTDVQPLPRLRNRDRLRIGYFCSLFDRENYMKPVWPLIDHHDRSRFEVHLFSDTRLPSRDYHYTGDLKIQDCAAAIAAAQLDILVDLNAYSRWRRLPVYALRPAPVIVSWFNSYATTGMSSIDFLIGDHVVAPTRENEFYSEKILRVDGSYLTFQVTYLVPDVTPPPCLRNGYITFGCLAPLYKITPPVIAAWAEILRRVPTARLLLKNAAFDSASNRDYLLQQIGTDRVQLEGSANHFEFLESYGKIDIALDTFPYNGGTTTTEALWQGVPVITFYGDRWASRTSASILRAGNLNQFVANDLAGYIDLAVSITPEILNATRVSMRDHLRASPVCDVASFTRQMEELYATAAGLR